MIIVVATIKTKKLEYQKNQELVFLFLIVI